MAVDEALLDGPESGWTLRFYGWRRPTVSIGYAQPFSRALDEPRAADLGMDLVRRPTGGRAVLHADEITYSLTGPAESGRLAGGIEASYRQIAEGLQTGLQGLGATVDVAPSGAAAAPGERGPCFSARTRFELSFGGRKLVGSAQRRRQGRLLQHGSILLGTPDPRLWAALGAGADEALEASIGLDDILRRRPATRALTAALSRGVGQALGMSTRSGVLCRAETRRARGLEGQYASRAFTRRK